MDEWASRFFEELDYVNEGENGTRFAEMMKKDLPQVMGVFFMSWHPLSVSPHSHFYLTNLTRNQF